MHRLQILDCITFIISLRSHYFPCLMEAASSTANSHIFNFLLLTSGAGKPVSILILWKCEFPTLPAATSDMGWGNTWWYHYCLKYSSKVLSEILSIIIQCLPELLFLLLVLLACFNWFVSSDSMHWSHIKKYNKWNLKTPDQDTL